MERRETADQATIKALNDEARSIAGDDYDDSEIGVDALDEVVRRHGMEEVGRDGPCIVYRMSDGRLVNCWIEGVQSSRIEDGGLGFDNQVSDD